MRTLLVGGLLVLAAVAFLPNTSAVPCDVGDTDTVCVQEYEYSYGDCDTGGYESGTTYASANVNGEYVSATGYFFCYYEPGWGTDYEGAGAWVGYSGSQGYATAGVGGFQDHQSQYGWCQASWYHVGPGHSGGGFEDLDQDVCAALGDVAWGSLIP